ncbi:alpha-1,4-glucan--maltose-1-phosphate maltosyltransferase [Bosea sp. RCC_152_1]|uniref:alpha-1,4-glucan--maltose-1-phosphate maltosyltransferase n=1 Tax=Bosea sp. RCC_152_1 TaxID=3239228 RepID=UPI003523ED5F
MDFWLDLSVDRIAARGELVSQSAAMYRPAVQRFLDPRKIVASGSLFAATEDPGFVPFWQEALQRWQSFGISGVRCHNASAVPLKVWDEIIKSARANDPQFQSFGWLLNASWEEKAEAGRVFGFVPSSVAWWTGVETWLVDEYNAIAPEGRLIGFPANPFANRLPARAAVDGARDGTVRIADAALLADGWLLPMGYEYGMDTPFVSARREDYLAAQAQPWNLQSSIRTVNEQAEALGSRRAGWPSMRPLALDARSTVMLRQFGRDAAHLVEINRNPVEYTAIQSSEYAARLAAVFPSGLETTPIPPGSGRVIILSTDRMGARERQVPLGDREELAASRIAIENVSPVVDNGRFPVKRVAGDQVTVSADIFGDGHDVIEVELLWRPSQDSEWSRKTMQHLSNDRWQATFPILETGRHVFAIEAWWSEFGTFRRDFAKKREAGLDLTLEIQEGRLLLEKFASLADAEARPVIEAHLGRLSADQDECCDVLLSLKLAAGMSAADPRPHATGRDRSYEIEADREAAVFASWYELFPRSITDSPSRHGTFRDVISRLSSIRDMGFDVLYFPPIHPIGRTNRKGRNNTLTPGPDDPGSPYAIGSEEGGHDAIHPRLGTLDDFERLVGEAGRHGLEIALDFAIQCSPDHPWLRDHPDWFSWRPDGSMRYAENPPKKYQDIVNVDFYAPGAIPDLWLALRNSVQFWVNRGVRIFRVDNPHTKPFPFWEWLIADIRSRDPRVLFLAEAFTRPKVMYRLGKVGFSQSYTYFTWRNTKAELTQYLTELNEAPARDVYRPHFFVNTPDINPVFLQSSGRPGFLIRAALAATLSGLWGVYSGFELCESAAIPGKEEYLDSEKYEIKPRDWQSPGNIVLEITSLNRIRRNHPALHSHLGLTFYNAFSDDILYFGKRAGDADEIILVAVNLNPHSARSTQIEVPLWEFGLPDHASLSVQDLMHGHSFAWHGKTQQIHLDPHALPFAIWRITPFGGDRQ